MAFTVGSSVSVRSNESVGEGTIKRSLPRRPEDGPRTKRWIVVFSDSVEREYTSRQLVSTEASTRKDVPAKQKTRKTRKNASRQPLSKEASALMQSFIKPQGSTKATASDQKTQERNQNKENQSSDSEVERETHKKPNNHPSQTCATTSTTLTRQLNKRLLAHP